MEVLDELLQAFDRLPATAQAAAMAEVRLDKTRRPFTPQPGPQTDGYLSRADLMLYGGEPGGGKTALECGLALNEHHRALIVRKNFVDLDGVLHTLDNIVGTSRCWVGGNRPRYDKPDGGVIDFMGLGNFEGKQGNPHDLICVDEAAQIAEDDFRMLLGWLRTDRPGQRTRVVLASNPPIDTVGDWLVDYFGPWLDERHPDPAEPGELRWFLPLEDGGWRECGPDDWTTIHGVKVGAQSRTFIRAKFSDNKYYDPEQYAKTLAALPDAVRRRFMTGNFMAAREDDEWQAVPTDWVRAAQERWESTPPIGIPMSALGVDVAQGGGDRTVIARRHDGWYAPLIVEPGSKTPNGTDVAGLVISKRYDGAKVIIDVGGGWGADAHGHLKASQVDSEAYMGVKATALKSECRQFSFANVRSAAYWRFREALNPGRREGSRIMLPPDKQLLSELCTPLYRIKSFGTSAQAIELESKEHIVERLKRSPDKADAVVMAWWSGPKMESDWQSWPASLGKRAQFPASHGGRQALSARIAQHRR